MSALIDPGVLVSDRSVPVWRTVAASVRGSGHEKVGLVCQDAHAVRVFGYGWVAVAVADGAGSAPRSDVGARAAVARAVEVLAGHVGEFRAGGPVPADEDGWRTLLAGVMSACREAVRQEAETLGSPVWHLATTLLVVLLGPEGTAAAQVGDGGTVIRTADGTSESLIRPLGSEHVNETTFLTSDTAEKETRFAYRPGPVRAVVTVTDGLQVVAFKGKTCEHKDEFFQPLFDYFEGEPDAATARHTLEEFLGGGVVRGEIDDDLTLVAVTREPAPSGPESEGV